MLETNRSKPPRPYQPQRPEAAPAVPARGPLFLSADDFDGTGILTGFDPCASNYWWMPELHAVDSTDLSLVTAAGAAKPPVQATRRASTRPHAAA
ncbi:MAG: hypothetical protein EBR28_03105 [Planctomycetia bacterium]|nr:hypothetical protein [Planctomycetia bacterium]